MADTKISALTALDQSTADPAKTYVPLFHEDGSPLNRRMNFTNLRVGSFLHAGASGSALRLSSAGNGVGVLTNDAGNDLSRICLGGTTSSFPALKRSGTAIHARLADDSAFAALQVAGLTATSATVNGNATVVGNTSITPAWSGTGTATTPLLVNVTADPGPANAASKLLDLQVGGSSLSYFRKDGALHVPSLNVSGAVAVGNLATNSGLAINSSLGWVGLSNGSGGGLRINSSDIWLSKPLGFTSVATHDASLADVVILRDAADILAQRRSTNGNTLKVYRTYTSSSTFERGTFGWHDSSSDTGTVGNVLRIGTEKGSVGGTARDVALITNGTTRVTLDATTGVPTIAADQIRVTTTKTPSSATDTGVAGSICWDANYLYVCTATNTWRRVAHATW